jgi:hypothetical protein
VSGRIVSTPAPVHRCRPGWTTRASTGGLYGPPAGALIAVPPTAYDHPAGTRWGCDCGQTWISEGSPGAGSPGRVVWRAESRLARWWRRF